MTPHAWPEGHAGGAAKRVHCRYAIGPRDGSNTKEVMMHRSFVAATLLVVAIAVPTLTEARERRYRGPAPDYVVAESKFGHGTITAPVRMTDRGPQIRLPRGTWMFCRKSCSETLRVETVDFWENQGPNRIDNECGILGCLRRGF